MPNRQPASSRITKSRSQPALTPSSRKPTRPTTAKRNEPEPDDEEPTSSFNGKLDHFNFTDPAASPSSAPSTPGKKRRTASRYAPPSKYAHLKPLTDIFAPDLIAIFVGTNPGVQTATAGHAYAHPSNSFWKMLHASRLTDRRLRPEEDVTLPERYQLGNTNIVSRPSRDAAELSREELAAGTPILEKKFRKWRPEAVCIVGKGIWESVWRWRYGRGFTKGEFEYGWQSEVENMGKSEDWEGARVYVTPSTSGLAASLKPHEKEALWMPFGEWVVQRRKEKAGNVSGGGEVSLA